MKKILHASLALPLLLAAGCTVGPNYKEPTTELPAQFDAGYPAPLSEKSPDLGAWWSVLNDPELDSLIHRALLANDDLRIATERLAEARAQQDVVGSSLFPSVNASGAYANSTGTNATRGRVDSPLNAASDTRNVKTITKIGGFDASWEIDLFGHVRRQVEAAEADVQASKEYQNGVLVMVIADVARYYVQTRSFQRRLEIAEQNTAAASRTADFMARRFRDGLGNSLDVSLSERQLLATQAAIPPLRAAIADSQRRLALLIGLYPEQLYTELQRLGPLPTPPPQVSTGLPSQLLRRRPDIRVAERNLAAATARVGVAVADYFPQITLTGALGYQAQGLSLSPTDARFIYSIGPGVRWPLLDFGRVDAGVQLQDARAREALVSYHKTVKTAILEVDGALGNFVAERERFGQLQKTITIGENVLRLATERYDRGLSDFLNVLDAQRQLYSLQDQAALAQEGLVTDWIALNKALGGGWEGQSPQSKSPRPAIVPPLRIISRSDNQPS